MSGQLGLFSREILPDTRSAISSPESEPGVMLSGLPDGVMTNPSGPDHVRANRSVRRERGKARRTNAICGLLGFDSSANDDLELSLLNRLRPVTDLLGSTLFDMTWKRRRTPAGRWIFALRASGRLISGSGYSSWQTPAVHDAKGTDRSRYNESGLQEGRSCALQDQAQLTNWATPQARDHFPAHTTEYVEAKKAEGHGMQNLNDQATLASWATPTKRDHKDSVSDGTVPTNALLGRQAWLVQQTDSGRTLNGSGAEMESGGQLNPSLSRWMMSLPLIWDLAAFRAAESFSRSKRKARQESCGSGVTETQSSAR